MNKQSYNIYSIYDKVSKEFVGLFYHTTDDDMIRTSLPSVLMDYPLRDIEVYRIGTFYRDRGTVKGCVNKVKVRTDQYLFPHSRLSSKGDDISLDELDEHMKKVKADAIAKLAVKKDGEQKDDEQKEVVNE